MLRYSKLLRSVHPATILWSVVLGGISGAAATLVRLLFRALQWLFTQNVGSLPAAAAGLPAWRRFITPVAGALAAAAVIALRRRHARQLGRDPRPFVDYVEASRDKRKRIPLVPNVWRTGASAFSIATGAAIGREGSMIQFAAAVTSVLERVGARLPALERFPATLAVACGVAGGVATAYQAPVAAVFFAIEIAVGAFRLEEIPPLSFAAATGWMISRTVLREGPLYPVPHQGGLSLSTACALILLAALVGCLGPMYQSIVRGLRWMKKLPLALALGGMVVGALSLLDTRVWGNADEGLNLALGIHSTVNGPAALKVLVALLALRLLATSMCVGVGTVGGVFTPTLFAGAALGAIFAGLLHTENTVTFAIVGMSSLIAAATHGPLMATFMAVELTGDWGLLPLLLAGNLIAWQIAKRLSPAALYAIATDRPGRQESPPATPQPD